MNMDDLIVTTTHELARVLRLIPERFWWPTSAGEVRREGAQALIAWPGTGRRTKRLAIDRAAEQLFAKGEGSVRLPLEKQGPCERRISGHLFQTSTDRWELAEEIELAPGDVLEIRADDAWVYGIIEYDGREYYLHTPWIRGFRRLELRPGLQARVDIRVRYRLDLPMANQD